MSLAGAVMWHDVECGAYAADLELWEEMAQAAEGPVLELGCGTGRVSLYLARRGHRVIGLDRDPELIGSLRERGAGLPLEGIVADACDFRLADRVALALAPMQVLQLLPGPAERIECLACVAAGLQPGGRAAAALIEGVPRPSAGPPPLPDVREVDGWIYSSLPVDVALDGGEIVIRRLRQTVSPAGELTEEPNEVRIQVLSATRLEAEAAEVGLAAAQRRAVPPTDIHVGSTVVVLEKEGS